MQFTGELSNLPKLMLERSVYARKIAVENPKLIEYDPEWT